MHNNFFVTQRSLSAKISRFSAAFFLATALALLSGCGSGGAGGSPASSGTGGAGGTGGTTGGDGTTAAAPTITFALTNSAGAAVNSVSTGAPATVKATLRDATGAAVPNTVVTFSTDATLATITPAAATALTDATGVATVSLDPASLTASGAGTLTATAQVGTPPTAVTGTIGYSVGASAITISAPVLGVGATALSAFGTTSVSVTVSSGGAAVTTPQNVTFASPCASSGKAVLSTGVATVAGVATGSYRDNGCAGSDAITATVAGVTSAPTTLTITPPTVGSIQFVSATPSTIFLKGTGGVETSQVQFKVVDAGGNPMSGRTVTFGLSTTVGGITLTPTPSTATSDANGLVLTNVNSGTVSTPVRVTAATPGATAGSTLTTQSSGLTVTTGIPTQDGFSLSATKLNPEFRDVDGNTTVLTARLADHNANPVPDGTVVNFTTEGGVIVASCQTAAGACSSTMTSQAPRPTNGRVTVLAYAVGEESFIDANGNGLADLVPNEMFDINGVSTDMPEAFRDDNENGTRDASETFIDFNQTGAFDAPDGKFNGVLCDNLTAPPVGSSAGTCGATKSIHVRGSLVIVFSGSTAVVSKISPAGVIDLSGCAPSGGTTQVDLRIVDAVGNPMPVGTTVAVTTSDGIMTGTSTFTQANTNVTPAAGASTHSVFVKDDSTTTTSGTPPVTTCTDPTASGFLTVTITTPGGVAAGVVSTAQFAIIN